MFAQEENPKDVDISSLISFKNTDELFNTIATNLYKNMKECKEKLDAIDDNDKSEEEKQFANLFSNAVRRGKSTVISLLKSPELRASVYESMQSHTDQDFQLSEIEPNESDDKQGSGISSEKQGLLFGGAVVVVLCGFVAVGGSKMRTKNMSALRKTYVKPTDYASVTNTKNLKKIENIKTGNKIMGKSLLIGIDSVCNDFPNVCQE